MQHVDVIFKTTGEIHLCVLVSAGTVMLSSQHFAPLSAVTGAPEPTHKFSFCHFISANGSACGRETGGVWSDGRAPVPITVLVGGVPGLGGVFEEYESTAAYCSQVWE